MLKVWITGGEGHVGRALCQLLDCTEYQILATDIDEVDITDSEKVNHYINFNRPDVVINCAGLTNLDECEKDIDKAYKVNAIGVRNVAMAAESVRAKLIQLSTDDVFDAKSEKPYNEFDKTHPRTIYGKSKEAGEKFVTQLCKKFVILRSSWIYGIGRDFVDEVLKTVGTKDAINVPNNRYGVPTSAKELAKVVKYFIDNDEYGLYHAVCKGSCSRYEFAKAILEYTDNVGKLEVHPVLSSDTSRPEYCVLDNMMLRLSDIEEPAEWRVALKEYLEETGGLE